MNKALVSRRTTKLFPLFIMALMASFILSPALPEVYAQKKKGEKNGVVDEAAQKKYMFELLKSWSFGWENYKNKQYRSAAKHFWKVTELDTIAKFPKVYRYLGDCYFQMNNADSAQIVFELGIEHYPEDAFLHRMVGYLYAQREQVDEAIAEYEKAIELMPDSKDDLMQLAALYVRADRVDDAIAAYDKVLQLDPNDTEAQQNQSALFSSTGDVQAAIENKENIREQQPENSQVRYDLGKMYFEQGNYEKSIERFGEFLALSPGDAGAMEYIGNAYKNLEKYYDAIAQFKKVIELQPKNKKIIAEISRCYKDIASFSSARSWANKALAIDRDYGLAWIALGEAYEASAEACVADKGGKVEFNDKLVYELAAEQYRRAMKDLAFRQDAERHLTYLQGVVPTKEDKFMHKGETEAEGPCYSWIK